MMHWIWPYLLDHDCVVDDVAVLAAVVLVAVAIAVVAQVSYASREGARAKPGHAFSVTQAVADYSDSSKNDQVLDLLIG